MTPEEVREIVDSEIDNNWRQPNYHGLDIKKTVAKPYKITAANPVIKSGKRVDALEEVWVVLEENPDSETGYKVYFDEKTQEFGLLTNGPKSSQCPIIVGVYGSFWGTVKSM